MQALVRRSYCGVKAGLQSTRSLTQPARSATSYYARWHLECLSTSASPQKRKTYMKNQCVLVTGATKGIGWAISRRLADLGCHVVGLARHTQDIDFPGYLYSCDLANAGETEDILRVIREKYPVDGMVNNVGVVKPEPLGEIDLSSLYQVYDLYIRAAVQVTQALAASMKARHEWRTVNTCSPATHG